MAIASNRRIDNLLLWPVVGVIFLALVFLYYQGWSLALLAPYALTDEGASMWASLSLSENRNAYEFTRLVQHPWYCTAYPPVYFALIGWIFKLVGPVFYPMRMVSMICLIVTLVISYRVFTLSGCSRLARVIGLLTLSSFYTVWAYSARGRVDMLGLMFMVMAIQQYLVLARKPKDDNLFRLPRLIVVATLCLMAAFTKQAFVLVVPAVAAALIVGRQWRLSILFMGLSAFLAIAAAWLINSATAGGFLAHMSFAQGSPFLWNAFCTHVTWLGSDWLLLLLSPIALSVAVIGYFKERESREGPYRHQLSAMVLAATLFALAVVLVFYGLGVEFAKVDEIIILAWPTAWLVAVSVDYVKRRYLAILFIILAIAIYVIANLGGRLSRAVEPMIAGRDLMRSMRFNHDLMLTEDCSIAIDLEAVSEFVDPACFLQKWKAIPGLFEKHMAEIKERICQKKYGAIVINSRDGCLLKPYYYWDESVIRAIKENYQVIQELPAEGHMQDFYLPRAAAKGPVKSKSKNTGGFEFNGDSPLAVPNNQ
ncbi:glycosyltransferase family 39 protein [bacterium]|nr:glycosyltransferase family 39 protein [bacterium]